MAKPVECSSTGLARIAGGEHHVFVGRIGLAQSTVELVLIEQEQDFQLFR